MKEKEIIFKSTSHPELTDLRTSDPHKYQELSQQVVEERLSELLPIFKRWQKNRIPMTMYEVSLRSIESQLGDLDYSIYDDSIEGKRLLTQQFYEKCMCYPIDSIIEAASKRSTEDFKRIKNLINRSAKYLYNERFKACQRLCSVLGYSSQQIENLPLMSFLPFRNLNIGIEWILMGDMDKIDDIVDDWMLLLCLDNEMFSSNDFIDKLKDHLGVSTFIVVKTYLCQRIADKNSSSKFFSSLRKKFTKQIKKLVEGKCGSTSESMNPSEIDSNLTNNSDSVVRATPKLKGFFLKKGVPFSSFVFGEGYMCYGNYIYKNEIFSRLPMITNTKSDLFIDVFLQNQTSRSKKKHKITLDKSKYLELKLVHDDDLGIILGEISRIRKVIEERNTLVENYESAFIISRNARAEDFKVSPGEMCYKNKYYLKSVKITSAINQSELSQIKKTFCLKEDLSRKKIKGQNKQYFLFHPANDFSFFLAECERLNDREALPTSNVFPLSGEFDLPWRYVSFYEGIMYLAHPNPSKHGATHPFSFRHPSISKSFRDLMSYIETRCQKFKVRAQDGVIVQLLNFKNFQCMIPQFLNHSSGVYGGIEELVYNKLSNSYSSSDFSNLKFVNKSPYLSHLASLQVSSRRIYRILERVIHAQAVTDNDEFGFLFTVKEYRSYSWIVYENVSDDSRSSILFQVRTADFDEAIKAIRTFFSSPETNKRQRLAQSTIRLASPAILSFRRIHHTNLPDWRSNLSSLL